MGAPVPALITPPFPEEQAKVVTDWAIQLGVDAAAQLVNQIRDWLGHPEKITQVTRKWSPDAAGKIVKSGEGIATAAGNLADYWEGRAQQGFDRYATQLKQAIGSTNDTIGKMAAVLTDSLGIITNAYKAAMDFISQCAKTILDILESVPDIIEGFVTRNPGLLLEKTSAAIFDALGNFVTLVNNLEKSTVDVLTGSAQAGLKMEAIAGTMPVPDNPPDSLGERDWWQVRPAR